MGVGRRLGMADAFHCINGCAMRVFGRLVTEDASDSSDGEYEGEGFFLEWIRIQSVLRNLLGRGHGNTHLVRAYQACGILGRPTIMKASSTRMIVYCSQMLRQSMRHFRARYMATWSFYSSLAATQGAKKRKHRKKRKSASLASWPDVV